MQSSTSVSTIYLVTGQTRQPITGPVKLSIIEKQFMEIKKPTVTVTLSGAEERKRGCSSTNELYRICCRGGRWIKKCYNPIKLSSRVCCKSNESFFYVFRYSGAAVSILTANVSSQTTSQS